MNQIENYLQPVNLQELGIDTETHPQKLGACVAFYQAKMPIDWGTIKLAILGVPEARNSYKNNSCHLAPDEIRRHLYQLYCWKKQVNIIDLGNMIVGNSPQDSYSAVAEIVSQLLQHQIIPIILGGSNDIAYAIYKGYVNLEWLVNMVAVDARFDLGREESPISADAYLDKIILQQPNFLLNYSNIGFQSYLVSPESYNLMQKLFFETYRVGMLRKNMDEIEPIVRNADLLTIDFSAVRRADAPGSPHSTINGFYGEEMCQIAQFSGMSDKLSALGFFEFDPLQDYNNQTAQLASQMIWYFVEGYLHRAGDTMFTNRDAYTQHSIAISDSPHDLIFYCSNITRRWWVAVPVNNREKGSKNSYFLPCSIRDFEMACANQISERWWRAYHKLNK